VGWSQWEGRCSGFNSHDSPRASALCDRGSIPRAAPGGQSLIELMLVRSMTLSRVLPVMLSVALAASAESQTTRWSLVGTTGDTTYYIDSAVVAASSGNIEVWTRAEFSRTIPARDGNFYDARVSRYRIDCAKGTWRSNETVHYRGSTFVRRYASAGSAMSYRPKWPQDLVLLQRACQMAAKRPAPATERSGVAPPACRSQSSAYLALASSGRLHAIQIT
jgi:hypothetical protein